MKFTVVTILPELIEPALGAGVVGRAREAGVITVDTVNPRDFTSDRHRTVDDNPYGGGPGMVMKPEPLLAAIAKAGDGRRILLSPGGAPLTQARVRELAQLPHLVLVCGRYEGIDERVVELGIDEEISIGDYVLSGGELGALVVIDAVSRLVPGVLGEPASADDESFSAGLIEYPQYTRPPVLDGRTVPEILTSGNHAAIAAWRREQAMRRTAARRPDLWARFRATPADRKRLPPLAARTHIALVHHPVVDRTGAVITTAVTNFDIHDLARSAMTYGLAGYHIVTPITSQREKAEHIASLWQQDATGEHRARALALVRTAASIEEVVAELTAPAPRGTRTSSGTTSPGPTSPGPTSPGPTSPGPTSPGPISPASTSHGPKSPGSTSPASTSAAPDLLAPIVVATSANPAAFPKLPRRTPTELVAELAFEPAPLVLLFGTGWGLADEIPAASRVLAPIEGASDWNHLSVRSAVAILLDRLFGRTP